MSQLDISTTEINWLIKNELRIVLLCNLTPKGLMYNVYHRSKFFTRFFLRDPSKSVVRRKTECLIASYNKYYASIDPTFVQIKLDDCNIVSSNDQQMYPTRVTIFTFKEFTHQEALERRILQLPFPRGLQVKIDNSMFHSNKHLHVYESNIKVFFDEEHVQFARGIAKWLLISNPIFLNITCQRVLQDRIILCASTPGTPGTPGTSKKERWGELYVEKESLIVSNSPKHQFKNITIQVFDQFRWLDYIIPACKECKGIRTRRGEKCQFGFIGENNIKLLYENPKAPNDYGEHILEYFSDFLTNVKIPNCDLIKESSGFIRGDTLEYYMVVITVRKRRKISDINGVNGSHGVFPIHNIHELDEMLKDACLNKEQSEMQDHYARQASLVIQ